MQIPLIRLQCGVNSYDWGKPGSTSAAARFAAATPVPGSDNAFSIQSDKPYAELWMGTHPSLPSRDLETQRPLLDLVQDDQALMGKAVTTRYGGKLPFLFKVLSINKALSIQAHPNKKLAGELHVRDAKNYPDDNHKPEMAIALTDFEGLCGFRPLNEISKFFSAVSSLRKLVGEEHAKKFEAAAAGQDEAAKKQALREAFTALMESSQNDITSATSELLAAVESEGAKFADLDEASGSGAELGALLQKLNGQFPNDIGLFVLFFLNFVKLAPGEALFLQADDIHAYISGDIMECMASSDNVVRAGFTPKFKDVKTLTSMLTYSYAPIEEQKMHPTPYFYASLNRTAYVSNSSTTLYDPPIEEFSVVKTDLIKEGAKAAFAPLDGPSIIICTGGQGTISVGPNVNIYTGGQGSISVRSKTEEMKEGYVFFIGALAECVLESSADEKFTTFRAICELDEQ